MIVEGVALICLTLTFFFAWKAQKWKMQALLLEEKLRHFNELPSTFKALSQEALESFLNLANSSLEKKHQGVEELIKPVKESLSRLDQGLKTLEGDRKGDQATLRAHLSALAESERQLRQETAGLSKALRAPAVRGSWGELQLKRVVELAGMLSHCDFLEQQMGDENRLRPDMLIKLPGGRSIIIDAKTPMEAYLEAMQTEEEHVRVQKLKEHAKQVRNHALSLSKKSYHQHFQPTPEFVVLFLPSENFFSSALEQDPALLEFSVEQGVILATPTTLIALLRAVAYGWKQESLSRHVERVSQLGHELSKRISDMTAHFAKTGKALATAVESYNATVRSLDTRVLVTARKFQEMGAASQELELESPLPIEKTPLLTEIE